MHQFEEPVGPSRLLAPSCSKVNNMVRKVEDVERKRILKNFRGKAKSFYGYMRKLQTVKDNVTVLMQDNGELTETDQETADVLGQYFRDVFTVEDKACLLYTSPSPRDGLL